MGWKEKAIAFQDEVTAVEKKNKSLESEKRELERALEAMKEIASQAGEEKERQEVLSKRAAQNEREAVESAEEARSTHTKAQIQLSYARREADAREADIDNLLRSVERRDKVVAALSADLAALKAAGSTTESNGEER